MFRMFAIICAMVLLSVVSMTSAWMMPVHYNARIVLPSRIVTRLKAGPFFEEEFEMECPDEDECEIDWDKMPQAAEEVENSAPLLDDCDDEEGCEIDWDAMPDGQVEEAATEDSEQTSQMSTIDVEKEGSLDKGRMKLEMSWQIDECETDEDSCEDFCPECVGSGKMPCRICGGTGMVVFGNDVRACKNCKDGFEECSSCRGTGKIAPWVTTFLDQNKHP
ncbi:unnamed protein product [Cylindrotheca closterium]|uniref:Uncharacterized protein n=1 Tax=Cylindrotheca closterium TaxID=2856 RepID=A0AAD2CFT1_9STRA|nr:unnamed protein product [Cylindrotheca closterium]